MRPGAKVLSLLAVPLNVSLLRALEAEETALAQLRQAVGHPPASTMRIYLRGLTEMGVLERRQAPAFPGSVEFRITRAGTLLLAVTNALQTWLDLAPSGPIELGTLAAKSATKALVDGWSAGIARAVAARPFTLTELHRLLPHLSYPSLERRLTAMRAIGQVEAQRNEAGRGTPHQATEWLRQAVGPLTAATGWERNWIPAESRPPGRVDVEAAFLLAVPLVQLPPEVAGVCRLAVELRNKDDTDYAGVKLTIENGKVVSWATQLAGEVDASAVGSPRDWLRWGNGSRQDWIELGGDPALGRAVLDGFLAALPPGDRAWQADRR